MSTMTIAALAREWTEAFSSALSLVRARRSEATNPLQMEAVRESERALTCVIAALGQVRDERTAAEAVEILRADRDRLRPTGTTHVIDEALGLLEDHILNPFMVDRDLDSWANAVRLVRMRIKPEDRDTLRDAMRADMNAFAVARNMDVGLAVRNLLRSHGFDEAALKVDTLDEVWLRVLSEALADPSPQGSDPTQNDVVYVGRPHIMTMPMERRWGYLTNVRHSRKQFVLYRTEKGRQLVLEGDSGTDATIPGPEAAEAIDSVADAYEMVLRWFSAMLQDSRLIGGKLQHITIVDTTDAADCLEMGNLWIDEGQVFERRCLDPETLNPLK